jgi:hypothetical protein
LPPIGDQSFVLDGIYGRMTGDAGLRLIQKTGVFFSPGKYIFKVLRLKKGIRKSLRMVGVGILIEDGTVTGPARLGRQIIRGPERGGLKSVLKVLIRLSGTLTHGSKYLCMKSPLRMGFSIIYYHEGAGMSTDSRRNYPAAEKVCLGPWSSLP